MADERFTRTELPVLGTIPAAAGFPEVTIVGNTPSVTGYVDTHQGVPDPDGDGSVLPAMPDWQEVPAGD